MCECLYAWVCVWIACVCVVLPSFALPPVWLQGEFVCVLFVLSTLVRGVPLSL